MNAAEDVFAEKQTIDTAHPPTKLQTELLAYRLPVKLLG